MAVHTLGTRPPLIQVGLSVGLTYLSRRLGRPPVLRTVLIDTGSVMTAINPTIATALHPLRLGTVDVSRPGGTIRRAPTYDIRLAFGTQSTGPPMVDARRLVRAGGCRGNCRFARCRCLDRAGPARPCRHLLGWASRAAAPDVLRGCEGLDSGGRISDCGWIETTMGQRIPTFGFRTPEFASR